MPATDDLTLLAETARAAGEIARGYFKRSPKIWHKPDSAGPVTQADLEVNALLEDRLRTARPGYGWLSEETPDDGARLDSARLFIVDPLDGTRAFIEGNSSWAHSLAVVDNGIPVAAAVYLPMSDKMYLAAQGKGATLNGDPIRVTDTPALDGATVLAVRSNFQPWFWSNAAIPGVKRHFRSSLAYRMALVAEGRFDAMLTLRPTWEWDVAAGALLIEEAGGRACDKRGAVLRFNRPTPQLNGIVAANLALQAEACERLV